ncbi:MAG: Mrp/NBP35 family ATP-binding protein [Halobacteriales archaeon]
MDENEVREKLRTVDDPDLDDDIVSLGLVNDVAVEDGVASVSLALGAPYSPSDSAIADAVREALADLDLEADLTAETPVEDREVLPDVKNVIAVASGKGGVGKSTIAANLAAGLSELGAHVGVFDADVYGPNIPHMFGVEGAPKATEDETIIPPERAGVKLMSMGFLVGDDDPVIWRGPMVHKMLSQLIEDVQWGSLDYMIVDLPPGTGDAQLTLLQSVPVTGATIVTTPQAVALEDARRGLEMFGRHETPVLGIVENMSTFVCPDCGSKHDIFDSGGGKAFAEQREMPFLGAIPLDPSIREASDGGPPPVLGEGETADAFRVLTENVADNAAIIHRRRASN